MKAEWAPISNYRNSSHHIIIDSSSSANMPPRRPSRQSNDRYNGEPADFRFFQDARGRRLPRRWPRQNLNAQETERRAFQRGPRSSGYSHDDEDDPSYSDIPNQSALHVISNARARSMLTPAVILPYNQHALVQRMATLDFGDTTRHRDLHPEIQQLILANEFLRSQRDGYTSEQRLRDLSRTNRRLRREVSEERHQRQRSRSRSRSMSSSPEA